jgi:hypothetical protein
MRHHSSFAAQCHRSCNALSTQRQRMLSKCDKWQRAPSGYVSVYLACTRIAAKVVIIADGDRTASNISDRATGLLRPCALYVSSAGAPSSAHRSSTTSVEAEWTAEAGVDMVEHGEHGTTLHFVVCDRIQEHPSRISQQPSWSPARPPTVAVTGSSQRHPG